jgi:hypothetical protein
MGAARAQGRRPDSTAAIGSTGCTRGRWSVDGDAGLDLDADRDGDRAPTTVNKTTPRVRSEARVRPTRFRRRRIVARRAVRPDGRGVGEGEGTAGLGSLF